MGTQCLGVQLGHPVPGVINMGHGPPGQETKNVTLERFNEKDGAVKGQRDMEEVYYGAKGLHWAVVPTKKKQINLFSISIFPNYV